jgi:uncharacterized protein (TIGR03067 family)
MKAFAASLFAAVVVAGLAVAFAADAPKADGADQKALQGIWTVTSAEMRGEKNEEIVGSTMTFTDDKISLKVKGKDEAKEAKYKLDPAAKPKHLDIMPSDKEETLQGIYELDGDNLKICMNDKGAEARPEKFEAAADKKFVLLVLKREKK